MQIEMFSDLAVKEKESNRTKTSGTFLDNMKLPVHRWYRYSAGFSAEWASTVVKERVKARV